MIRPLLPGDVVALATRLAPLPLLCRYRRSADALGADLAAALAAGDGLLVHDDGAPDALAWFMTRQTLGLGGYLKLLAVAPDALGQGIGGAMLAAFENAVSRESRHAFLLVSDFNERAQSFYERHGYVRSGALPGLVLPDVAELIYWRRLKG